MCGRHLGSLCQPTLGRRSHGDFWVQAEPWPWCTRGRVSPTLRGLCLPRGGCWVPPLSGTYGEVTVLRTLACRNPSQQMVAQPGILQSPESHRCLPESRAGHACHSLSQPGALGEVGRQSPHSELAGTATCPRAATGSQGSWVLGTELLRGHPVWDAPGEVRAQDRQG